MNLQTGIEIIGTFAFAISGIRLSTGKMDLFGAYMVGMVTAVGGGTLRDLLLGVTPVWMTTPQYVLVTAAALISVMVFKEKVLSWGRTLFSFDAIGLGLFTVIGISKSLEAGFPFWVSVIMGTITGSAGGVFRDILINEVPLLFRQDLYATACLLGGFVFWLFRSVEPLAPAAEISAALTVILVRVLAVKYKIHMPLLKM